MNGNQVPKYKIDTSELEYLKSRLELCIDLANGAKELSSTDRQMVDTAVYNVLYEVSLRLTQHIHQLEDEAYQ